MMLMVRVCVCSNKNALDSPIGNSFSNLWRYHLGTVALGSFLIATVQFVRAILTYIQVRVDGRWNALFNLPIFTVSIRSTLQGTRRIVSPNAYSAVVSVV